MAIVTISRGTYSGGIAVAEAVAAKLSHPCISREVVVDAARESGVAEEVLQSTLEDPPHFWQKTPGRIAAHLNLVRAALLKRAREGALIYHGYAGHLLLSGIPHVLRVRIIADPEYRIRAAMEDKHLSHEEAAAFVRKLDNQLEKWTKFLYGVESRDPFLYDLVLNLQHLSVDGAARMIVHMTQLDDFQPNDEARKAFENLLLSSNVWAALTTDRRTSRANVRVAADAGRVFITGLADNRRTLGAVLEVAQSVRGVATVHSEVGVGKDWRW